MAVKFKSMAALALSAAMLLSMAACGTTDSADSSASASSSNTTTGYDVSGVQKDDELAKLVTEGTTVKDGELSSGMELSYAPAEFYAEDGKTPVGYDVDMTKAIAQVLGLKPKIVSSMFDTIIPSIGTKYDLGITSMTITKERMESVDFVSYYRAGSTWAVQKGNPKKLDASDMCGAKIAVQTGTTQDARPTTRPRCSPISVRPKPPPPWPRARPMPSTRIRRLRAMPFRRPTALKLSVTWKASPSRASPSKKATKSWMKPCRKPCRSLWMMART